VATGTPVLPQALLPPWATAGDGSPETTTGLADLNADWEGDVDLSGVSYRLVPLDDLP
jgi:hypothetical protein